MRRSAIKLVAKSLVEVETAESLTMVVPTITGISPNPAKNGENITVTGSNLDLIVRAVFGGDKPGTLLGGSATSIQVQVPADATESTVTFVTAADKSVVSGSTLNLVKPVITTFAPQDIQFTNELTITGNHLDLVATVKFSGGTEVSVSTASLTEIKVNVPVGNNLPADYSGCPQRRIGHFQPIAHYFAFNFSNHHQHARNGQAG